MIKQPTIKQVQTIVSKIYPQAIVLNYKKAGLGNMNWVYIVDLINSPRRLILKIVWRKDREEDEILIKEAKIIKKLNQNRIQGIPELIDLNYVKKDVPFVYLLESYLKGLPLIDCYKKMKSAELKQMIKKVAMLITEIQKIKYKKISEFEKNRPEYKSFTSYIKNSALKHYKVCLASKKMDKSFVDDSYDFVLEESKKIKDKEFVLNHSDFSSHNILIYQNKFSGIIDFEDVQSMTPEFDLVTFYHEFLWKKPELWPLLLQEYVKANKVPKDFKERLNIVMGYRSFRYIYIAIKNKIFQYLKNDIIRMEEVLDGRFLKTIKY